ncbi:hypothetical protein GAGA_3602 [Paraglaciecola agarilytica NO2]|uniref:Uncharacterized protein n=1 Tax=Paraglaciecola agarilytica NO2 TaxID=1125747 RepID=A0ABQ0IAR7_9ALTE|nr:hypothetical protein GAGA_3602 [Paraglaciecola agarilytica NO2]
MQLLTKLSNGNNAPLSRFTLLSISIAWWLKFAKTNVLLKNLYSYLGGHKEILGMWIADNQGAKF